MVDKVKIKQWIEALESGEYPQTRFTLWDDSGYCCIGVLAKIAGILYEGRSPYNYCEEITGKEDSLFYNMNDRDQMSFAEIAGYLRKEYDIT